MAHDFYFGVRLFLSAHHFGVLQPLVFREVLGDKLKAQAFMEGTAPAKLSSDGKRSLIPNGAEGDDSRTWKGTKKKHGNKQHDMTDQWDDCIFTY